MASQSLGDRLARASTSTKIAILVLVLGALGLLYYNFFYSDLVDEEESLVAVKKRQIEDERRLLKRKAEYQELLRQKADVEDRLRRNQIKLPESSELPAFFQHLETQAATANVRILLRTLEKEVPVETYVKVPVRMEVAGDFYQINNYFKLLNETARIITIENLFIGDRRRDRDRVILTAKFTASTFRQANKPGQPGAPAPTQPPPPNQPPPAAPTPAATPSQPSPAAPAPPPNQPPAAPATGAPPAGATTPAAPTTAPAPGAAPTPAAEGGK
jgi:Tfp pilus assembly protein PilO